jgi:hypothetical protein
MIEAILQSEIILVRPCNEEVTHLIKQLEIAEMATAKFTKGEISFSDFLELMELAEVDIDEYLGVVETNLLEVGIKV